MKNLWDQYSYAIILVVLSCIAAFLLTFNFDRDYKEQFMKVTVTEGDSLWAIADDYVVQHEMSPKQFVQWMKKHNDIDGDRIFPGEELMIPITNESPGIELADGTGKRL